MVEGVDDHRQILFPFLSLLKLNRKKATSNVQIIFFFQERQRALEKERLDRIEELKVKRQEQIARIEQQKIEKEKEREKLAKERAR